MLSSSSALYSLLVPKLWNYAQQNIINISAPALGSSLFEISANKNVRDVSYLLDNSKPWVLTTTTNPSSTTSTTTSEGFIQEPHQKHEEEKSSATLLLELYLVCNVRKVVLDFNRQALPSEVEISYSSNEKKINFRKLAKLRNTDLKRVKPFVIYFTKPVQLKYMKFKITLAHTPDRTSESTSTTSCKLNSIKLFGTPVLSTDNLFDLYHKNQDQLKALAEMIGLKKMSPSSEDPQHEKKDTENLQQQPASTKSPSDSEEGITIEILPDDDKNAPHAPPKVDISDPRNRSSKL
ncbi:hypothetical protein FDP41_002121 [Naegleria fowleri]|uniref:Uncharacterized protein n=1 Tax=Naegleria fowleri TaxID=5763 RepID=A0A6A5BX26_NAEFO|nr:uncharacterized protein FDP41_002121 [Naegleria fowleri]KAF0979051.1 hypothetical protein FDP41_002121 [Naegleria fowleri]CAG4719255.1 unnamed protein product [Naegleria fowleri]